jgi:hypothetical protein
MRSALAQLRSAPARGWGRGWGLQTVQLYSTTPASGPRRRPPGPAPDRRQRHRTAPQAGAPPQLTPPAAAPQTAATGQLVGVPHATGHCLLLCACRHVERCSNRSCQHTALSRPVARKPACRAQHGAEKRGQGANSIPQPSPAAGDVARGDQQHASPACSPSRSPMAAPNPPSAYWVSFRRLTAPPGGPSGPLQCRCRPAAPAAPPAMGASPVPRRS